MTVVEAGAPMRISNSSLSKTGSRRTERAESGRARSTGPGSVTHSSGEDTVATGSQHELVSQAVEAGASERTEHIGQLKSALESGNYVPDAAEVSRAVVAEALSSGKG